MKDNIKRKGFTLMEVVIVISLIGLLLSFAIPNISKYKNSTNSLLINHDSNAVKTLLTSDLLTDNLSIIDGKVINIKDLDKFSDGKSHIVYLNGKTSPVTEKEAEGLEYKAFKSDFEKKELYKLNSKYIKEGIDTSLKGDFYTNIGGDIYYLSKSVEVDASGEIDLDVGEITGEEGGKNEVVCDTEAIERRVEELQRELNALEKNLAEIENNNQNSAKEIGDLKSKIEKLRKEISDNKLKISNEKSNHSKAISEIDKEIEIVKSEISELENSNNQDSELISSLKSKISDLVSEKEQLESNNKSVIDNLNSELSKLNSELKDLDGKIRDINEEIKNLTTKKEKLEAQINDSKDKIIQQTQAIADKNTEISKITEEISKLNEHGDSRVIEAEKKLQEVTKDRDRLKELLAKENIKKNELLDKIKNSNSEQLASQLKEINANIEKIEGEIKAKETEITNKETQVETLTKTKEGYEDQLATLKIENKRLIKLVEDLKEELQSINLSNSSSITEINKKISDNEKENLGLKVKEKDLKSEKAGLKKSKSDLLAKLQQETETESENNSKIEKLKGDISKLDLDISSITSEIEGLNEEIESLKKEKLELDRQVAEKLSLITKLKEEQKKLTEEKAELEQNLNKISTMGKALYDAGLRRLESDLDYSKKTIIGVNLDEANTLITKMKVDKALDDTKFSKEEKASRKSRLSNLDAKIVTGKKIQEIATQVNTKQLAVLKSSEVSQLESIQRDIKSMPESYDKNRLLEMLYWMEALAIEDKKVVQVSLGGTHSAAITSNGELYTWGDGSNGKLGHGDTNDQPKPEQVDFFKGKKVKEVFLGYYHSSAITEDGQLYTWGNGSNGRLGHGDTNDKPKPEQVEALRGKKVKQVSLGDYHSAAITEDGQLYTWGKGSDGQLGHGSDKDDKKTPEQVEALRGKKVKQVSLGDYHSAAITEDGQLYTWGDGDHGRLGHGSDTNDQPKPKQVDFKGKKVKQVSLGGPHSSAITEDGQLYTWGEGSYGRLGHGSDTNDQPKPKQVDFKGKKVKQVSLGGPHSSAITEDGQLYTWGKGSYGRLGHGSDKENQETPKQVEALRGKKVKQVSLGDYHSAAITEDGQLYTWGDGDNGRLGHGSDKENQESKPKQVQVPKEKLNR